MNKLFAIGALLLGFAVSAAADDSGKNRARRFDAVVPSETALFVSVKNAGGFRQKLDSEVFAKARENAEMKKWLDGIFTGGTGNEAAKKELGIDLAKAVESVGGEVAIAIDKIDIAALEGGSKEPTLVILVDAGAKMAEYQKFHEDAMQSMVTSGYVRSTDTLLGTEIVKMDKSAPGTANDLMVSAVVGTTYLYASTVDYTRVILGNLKAMEVENVLASNPKYRSAMNVLGDPDGMAYANLAFIKDISKTIPDEMQKTVADTLFEKMGLLSLDAAAVGFTADKTGAHIRGRLFTGARTGFLKTLATNRKIEFPAVVPEDASEASIMNVDLGELWTTLEQTFEVLQNQMQPEGAPPQDFKTMVQSFLGVDPKEDIIDALAGGSWSCSRYPAAAGATPETVVGFHVKDEKRLKTSVEAVTTALSALMAVELKNEEYMGQQIWTLPTQGNEISVCMARTELLVGTKEMIKEVVRRLDKGGKSLFETDRFKALANQVPEKVLLLNYVSGEGMLQVLSAFQQGFNMGVAGGMVPGGAPPADAFNSVLNLQALPDREVFAQFVAGGIGYVAADDDGFTLHQELRLK